MKKISRWFEADRDGLARISKGRGKGFITRELLANSFDARATEVAVRLERVAGRRACTLWVEDNAPGGFADISSSFTLFGGSTSKDDPTKRGRFCLGDKQVIACFEEVSLISTNSAVRFNADGTRESLSQRRPAGTLFEGRLLATLAEQEEILAVIRQLLVPPGVRVTINGEAVPAREQIASVRGELDTVKADEDGVLRKTRRKTEVHLYEPLPGEEGTLFELGIPVVVTGDRFHVDIRQKVPLSPDRDNVPAAFLREVRGLALNVVHPRLTREEAGEAWVLNGLESKQIDDEAVRGTIRARCGDKAVIFDRSDKEGTHRAMAAGYAVIHGGAFSKDVWKRVREVGALLPAGQVTPSPKPFSEGGSELRLVPEGDWTPGMHDKAAFARVLAERLLDASISVEVANDAQWPFAATYGPVGQRGGQLTLNKGRLGAAWFELERDDERVLDLLTHEFGHHFCGNHLSADYYKALTRLSARLARLALRESSLFRR